MRIVFLAAAVAVTNCMMPFGGPMPPIIGAAREGDVRGIEKLVKNGADPNVRAGVNDWTPLMHAIHKNQAGSVQALLANGARVDDRGGGGTTAIVMAAGYGYTPIVQMLLKAGANPRLKTNNGVDALVAAVGGVSDIDRFTVGHCQTETVRALLSGAPGLKLKSDSSAIRIARFGGCSDVLAMIKQ